MTAKQKAKVPEQRRLRVTKSHDGLDLDDIVTVVGEPDPRTAALLGVGYFEWADEPAAGVVIAQDDEAAEDAGIE